MARRAAVARGPRLCRRKVGGAGMPPPCPSTECTQDGQGGLGPQESLGCTEQDETPRPLGLAPARKDGLGWPPPCPVAECTQDGQGSLSPQESQGRTERQGFPKPRSSPVVYPSWGAREGRKPKISSGRAVTDAGRVNLAKTSWGDLKGATLCVPKGTSGLPTRVTPQNSGEPRRFRNSFHLQLASIRW